ncbi:sensor histidine kinase [Undibacterium danionis]|uniref:Sensor histidine kinase n=1 Tax=Undibacterium danionis TaxID=1812100 RepID=A0ABV6IHJ3_9BURK
MLINSLKTKQTLPSASFALFVVLGTCLGCIFTSISYSIWIFISFAIVYQASFLSWIEKNLRDKSGRGKLYSFCFKLQTQSFFKSFVFWGAMFGSLCLIDLIAEDASNIKHFDVAQISLVLVAILKISFVTSISVAFWQVHTLSSKDSKWFNFAEVDFSQESIKLHAGKNSLCNRLEHYLQALNEKGTPKFSRMFFESDTKIRKRFEGDNLRFELTWLFCPVTVGISVHSNQSENAEIHITYQMKRASFSFGFFPNPVDVQALKTYLKTYVINPMQDELSLTGAISKQDELRKSAIEMQLRTLQAQIEPHFLFNTLANLRQMYRVSNEAGEDMLNHLISYLRSSVEEFRSESSTVEKEMDLALHYLAIMKIRMGDRLSYSFIIGDSLNTAEFPSAMLISLVENAIKHGLSSKVGGKLIISAHQENQHLKVTVEDNGPGFSSVGGTGVGLSNIRQRLDGLYGDKAWLEVGALHAGGFVSSIIIPLNALVQKNTIA